MLMLLLPAKFLFLPPELKQNSKIKVDVYSVRQFFAKPMLAVVHYELPFTENPKSFCLFKLYRICQ